MLLNEIADDSKAKASKFIKIIYKDGMANPMGRGVIFGVGDALVHVELSSFGNMVHIGFIGVLEDKVGKGFGDFIMKKITKEADKQDITLHLQAVPVAVAGKKIPKAKLIKFYKKNGFIKQKGAAMIREPK